MICGRCNQPIRPGEPFTHHIKDSASVGGETAHIHVTPCRRVPTQSTQDSIRH